MRWEGLFADLEAQADVLEHAERAAEVEERARGEIGALGLLDRARAAIDASLRVRLAGPLAVSGRLRRVGPDWLLIDEGAGREIVVAAAAVMGVRGLSRYSAAPGSTGVVESRLGLRHVLRGIGRDRSALRHPPARRVDPRRDDRPGRRRLRRDRDACGGRAQAPSGRAATSSWSR